MSGLEDRLRDARDALGDPDRAATERAHEAALGSAGDGRGRSRWRIARALIAASAAVGAAFAIGYLVTPSGASGDTTEAAGPGFLPASGWETFQTGATSPPQAPSATTANVPLGPDVFSGTYPWETIGRLETGDVLLQATFLPTGESEAVDAQFPRRELPLSFDDAQSGAQLEGQPPNVTALRLLARLGDWNVDLFVFLGGEAAAGAREAAEEQLARLVVPE